MGSGVIRALYYTNVDYLLVGEKTTKSCQPKNTTKTGTLEEPNN